MDFLKLLFIAFGLGVIILINVYKFFLKKSDKKKLENLKLNAIKIPVKLTDIMVKSNSWTEEAEKYTSKNSAGIVLYNKFTNNDNKNVDYVNVNLHRLTYEFEYDRKRYLYTTLLDIEKEKLKIWFVFHKETILYLNPKTEEMYLDLEFMNN